jgi:thioesterase domain-containing protein
VLGTLSSTYGFELPTVALLHHPTVAILAEMIPIWAAQATSAGTSFGGQALPAKNLPIITIRTQGTRAPIFICPGGHGSENELLVFAKMLVMLDLDRPIHGLRLSAFTDKYSGMSSLAGAAAELGEQLLIAHPHGAFILMGECGSGVLAAEIARWIEQVAPDRMPEKIILLDSWTNEHRLSHGILFQNTGELVQSHMNDFFRLLLNWETLPVNFPMELINSEGFLSQGDDPSLGWQKLSRHPLPVHRVPGDHVSYIREHAGKVASVIHRILDTDDATAASA